MIVDNDRVCQGVKSISYSHALLIKQHKYLKIKYFNIQLQYTNILLLFTLFKYKRPKLLRFIFNNRKSSSFDIFTHIIQFKYFIFLTSAHCTKVMFFIGI